MNTDDREMVPWDVEAFRALHPILQSRRLSRLRGLDVACPEQHRLAQVIQTPKGPVIHGTGPMIEIRSIDEGGDMVPGPDGDWIPGEWETTIVKHNRINRSETVCRFVKHMNQEWWAYRGGIITDPVRYPDATLIRSSRFLTVQCRCRTRRIWGYWIADQLNGKPRRVIFE